MNRVDIALAAYAAFAAGDRAAIERLLAPGFTFSAPPDPHLDRDGFFARCWPGAGNRDTLDFVRTLEAGHEVIVTYERTRAEGGRGRNTEIFAFEGDQIVRQEVYFGWDVN